MPFRHVRLSCLLAALASTHVSAAPTTTGDVDGVTPPDVEARELADKMSAPKDSTGSRTIDLLIDMQQRSAGLQFNERQAPARSGEIKPRATANAATTAGVAQQAAVLTPPPGPRVEVPPLPRSGLFGSGATPMVQSARVATVEPPGGAAMEVAPRREGVTSSGAPLPAWLLLPREVIEYVRENRWLVLSSVAAGLLLIWGVSSLFARVAANAGRVPGPQSGPAFSGDRWNSGRQEARPARRRSHRRPG